MAKRPVPKYDFKAFGAAIKAAREGRKESRKKVGDEMFISPRYLANIENKGQHPSLQIFFELIQRYHISVDQFLLDTPAAKDTKRRQLDALLDGIVDKILEAETKLAEYTNKETLLNTLQNTFPDTLKKSILQWAVQGKLVPQDPADEPASILLERIRTEKQRLVREGKIKKAKHESVIFRRDNSHYEKLDGIERCIDDELPFEVPDSWELIRLNDVGIYRKGPFGSSLTKSMFVPKGANSIKVYEQKNAIQKDASLGEYYITKEYYEEKMQSFTVQPGDIIVSCAGTIGETYVLPNDIEVGIINQALMRMSIYAPIDIDYFLLYFDYVLKESARNSSKGSAIKNIPPFAIFKQMLLPLPPVAEQRRIVESVNFINSIIESLR